MAGCLRDRIWNVVEFQIQENSVLLVYQLAHDIRSATHEKLKAHFIDNRESFELIHKLKPLDRDVILSYLEGLGAHEIGEITGLSAQNVATKIHRIKNILTRIYNEGGQIRD